MRCSRDAWPNGDGCRPASGDVGETTETTARPTRAYGGDYDKGKMREFVDKICSVVAFARPSRCKTVIRNGMLCLTGCVIRQHANQEPSERATGLFFCFGPLEKLQTI